MNPSAMYTAPVQHQPSQHHTTVILQQPTAAPNRIQMQERDWNSGLCACFNDILSCALAYFFPCCFSCYLACRMDESCFVPICVPGGEVAMRTKLRVKNGIRGSICDDCMTIHLCYLCGLAQMAREINATQGRGFV